MFEGIPDQLDEDMDGDGIPSTYSFHYLMTSNILKF